MGRIITTLIYSLLFSLTGSATTFTAINSGSWSNNTSVWSIDGYNPCGCSPSATISGDTVIIRSTILQNGHITITGNGLLKVLPGALLDNTNFKMIVENGLVLLQGATKVKELNIGILGTVDMESAALFVQSRILVEGNFHADFSNVYINQGNIDVYAGGSFSICTNTKVYFITGNYQNAGTTSLCANSCIHMTAGNIKNYPGGIVNGDGSMITDNGNITNDGTWAVNVKWCSAGSSSNMPTTENCAEANISCNFVPLPTELVSYNVINQNESNVISWYTISEINGDYYLLERSSEMENWAVLTRVNVEAGNSFSTHYIHMDDQPLPGISYYRLTLISVDGKAEFSSVLGVNTTNIEDVVIFPNPTADHITVRFSKPVEKVMITLTDHAGNIVEVFEGIDTEQETIQLPSPCGLYFIKIDCPEINQVLKVIKK
ncbi:MAG: T9SS type A sorting domain-containing protein [Flavobacteriia bacterium]|jgi:hypothetical protein